MKNRKIIKHNIEYFIISSFLLFGRIMPRKQGLKVFSKLGILGFYVMKKDRQKALENLALAFPDAPDIFRRSMARAMFKSIACNFFEFIKIQNADTAKILHLVDKTDGWENFDKAYSRGRGLICITGHIGCWELMAAYVCKRGYPVAVVARRLWLEKLQNRLAAIRESFGVKSIDRDQSPRVLVDFLGSKGVTGILIDQNTRLKGIYVPFFNKPAHTASGIAKLACITNAMVLPIAIFLNSDLKHEIKILDPIDPASISGSKDERIETLTALFTKAVETLIRIDPKQWVWFHDRWRRREEDVEIEYAASN